MTSPTDTATLLTVPAASARTRDSIFIDSSSDVALVDLIAFVDNDFENAGHDLGANILGHHHPTLFGHAVC